MLIKEYRIPLPLTVEEYRIAQLFMIAKKSREESKGAGSGVEILVNEPYDDGPGGKGQYTHKLYHVGSHLPGWFKSLLPKSALTVEEEAWNAYPYTKTRYTCPFVEKFFLEIETYYFPDNGHQENVFKLSGSDLRNRIVDLIDVVKDQLYGADYVRDEDPKMYVSQKTGRGPLTETWLEDYWNECRGKQMPLPNGKSLMCAYKLCRVEFRYWGMQTKLEKFIHDVALRKTMLRAHRQAWAWQDEWHGLTMDDIRQIERQTQEALKRKMGAAENESQDSGDEGDGQYANSNGGGSGVSTPQDSSVAKTIQATLGSIEKPEQDMPSPPVVKKSEAMPSLSSKGSDGEPSSDSSPTDLNLRIEDSSPRDAEGRHTLWSRSNSKAALHSPGSASSKSFNLQVANWRMESIVRDSDSGSEEEFFDCQEDLGDSGSLAKWSSLDLLTEEDIEGVPPSDADKQDSIFSQSYLQRVASERSRTLQGAGSIDASCPGSPITSPAHQTCRTSVLILVLHAGSILDANVDLAAKKSDITTFRGAFESVMRQHYPSLIGRVAIKLVSCPSVCTEALGVLSSLSPYSFDVSPSCTDTPQVTHDSIPVGAIPLFATSAPEYQESVSRVINAANGVYQEFLKSEEGQGFSGQVCFIGDGVGSILGFDALCRFIHYQSRHDSENSILDSEYPQQVEDAIDSAKSNNRQGGADGDNSTNVEVSYSNKLLSAPAPRRRSSSASEHSHHCKLDFEVSDFFMFGSPLALVLAYRKISSSDDKNSPIPKPMVQQIYNLFHPTDPVAARLEPLLSARFSMLPPVNVARYQKYPLGNGQPYHLLEVIQANPQMFAESLNLTSPIQGSHLRRMSEVSIQSTVSGVIDSLPLQTINALTQKWWGTKRLDYALYCPEGLANFPTNALPHLFHASYWESSDVIAFILRQLARIDGAPAAGFEEKDTAAFNPGHPREKWIKKRTSVKLKNVAANHRANDVIVKEGAPQILTARFMYGPLDMITLAGEKVDIHIMKDVRAGEWTLIATEVTDKTGRVSYTIPDDKALGYGMYPVKMVVRGDHTSVDFYMAVVPPKTEFVVFSIDGSFTASMSVTGRDPKVRAGAVDVVRHWQELGYLIVYITGRPDMQQQKVVSWLSQHNFPHGLLSFADGFSTDPLGHKTMYLRNLIQEHGVAIHVAYGSSKDISVYTSIGLKPKQIFIVGKVSKKHHTLATILQDGYAAHLTTLMAPGGSRPAQGNARMVIPRGYFGLPGQNASIRRRSRSAKRATSYPLMGGAESLDRSASTKTRWTSRFCATSSTKL
ncbi:protein retinal degeneration B isoform X3 [Schistocerca gregaria]|uniref:protein retinal degeneration B isoform X3 n=1 Tax=Schistocerca gregaria TaxID=7010 RepID=UPI00211E136E|nr:protein retinal degeneration B isoform X3 [Schistocerca gregaria]XP_049861399.1 protein retinal degeneration B isoform X3 [Schistocerca gregaria]